MAALKREQLDDRSADARNLRLRKKRQTFSCCPRTLWKQLRSPFVLPPAARGLHTCQWEIFGTGLAGCLLCGEVHVCGIGSCKERAESEDSEVCVISGLCIRNIQAEEEFTDTCIGIDNPHLQSNDGQLPSYDVLLEFSRELLLSARARECFELQKGKLLDRLYRHLQEAEADSAPRTLVDTIALAVQMTATPTTVLTFDTADRERLSIQCAQAIDCLLNRVQRHIQLSFKHNDMRNTVFGLIFLLRQGVYVGGTCIVPCITNLHLFLPNEGLLERCFGFRAKYITDIENKCKYGFRIAGEGPTLRKACSLL